MLTVPDQVNAGNESNPLYKNNSENQVLFAYGYANRSLADFEFIAAMNHA
jgi:hypothetical protein